MEVTAWKKTLYQKVLKRNSTFFGFVVVGAVVGEALTDSVTNFVWNTLNKEKLYRDYSAQKKDE